MRMNQRKIRYQYILPLLCFVFLLCVPKIVVQAATGAVTYGSEGYEWEVNTTNPIGVYVTGDEVMADYEVCLSYDDTMLRYVGGASEQVGNLLYIRGTGSSTQYKTTLQFETLRSGRTQIQVVSAVGHTVLKPVSVSGNQILSSAAEDFQISFNITAPITIPQPGSSRLAELVVEPQNITGFSADILEYAIEVPAEVEELDVSYIPEDERATVEVSDTSLEIGENTVTVTVQNDNIESVYTIHVIRQIPVVETEESVEPTEESVESTEESAESIEASVESSEEETEETLATESAVAEPEDKGINITWNPELMQKVMLGIGCVLVVILAILYIIYSVRLRMREKQIQSKKTEKLKVIDMENTVIKVSNVTMKFKIAEDEADSVKEYFVKGIKKKNSYSELKALNNISFEIKQGEVVGIIGTNGSGKSTMLKILSGALKPTKGRVEVDHSKVQMLTLGTGFDMELTARENVYLNGSLIGYTKEFIDEKYDEIVKFAELEGFMEERMKNFSSGMKSRLGFAIATMRDAPDILILDEVLSVGDMFFRKKSEKRIREMIHSGATVLIVSHSIDTIIKNCTKVIWIEKGVLQMVGDPKTVCEAYKKS